jgi:hypothetical protein
MRVPALVSPRAPRRAERARVHTLAQDLVVCVGRGLGFFVAGRTCGRCVVGRGVGFVVGAVVVRVAAVVDVAGVGGAYVHIGDLAQPGRLAVMEPHGSPIVVDTVRGHIDGPEWSPNGKWIYFNTEGFTDQPGHAQLARIPDTGGPVERLVTSDTVDWFPHLSPDSQSACYIAFPTGTLGHPADRNVEVRVIATSDWSTPLQHYPLFGGQGTINVNSWSPDSRRFAFIAFPVK